MVKKGKSSRMQNLKASKRQSPRNTYTFFSSLINLFKRCGRAMQNTGGPERKDRSLGSSLFALEMAPLI
jgi:hypothetical protein